MMRGGITVGILPGDKRQEGNGYLKIEIPTGMGFIARSQALINAADGVTAIQGGIGTLGELCQSNYQKVPSVALIGSGGTADLYSDKKLDARDREPVKGVNNPKEALDYLLARLAH